MKLLKKLWAVWYVFIFLFVFFTLIFPFQALFIQRKKWHGYANYMNSIWAFIVCPLAGHWIFVKNRKNFKKSKRPFLVVANHSSYIDIPILMWSLPFDARYIGKAELRKIPAFGYMFRKLHIPVNRSSKIDSYRAFKKASEFLENGKSVVIFPEGTIPDSPDQLGEFKNGVFALAIQHKVPILPLSIIGSRCAFEDPTIFRAMPKKVTVIVHEPVIITNQTEQELKSEIYQLLSNTVFGYERKA
jgi:1-acyl-sn-glycerol-3-phosphate acyltransferase